MIHRSVATRIRNGRIRGLRRFVRIYTWATIVTRHVDRGLPTIGSAWSAFSARAHP